VARSPGYAYAALNAMAELAAVRDDLQRSAAWRARAERLCAAIEGRFWVPELNFYAIAIDGDGKPCSVHASNGGHLLYCGVPSEERGAIVANELLSNRFPAAGASGHWPAARSATIPLSYHNGSIWPHDTSLCAAGISRYGGHAPVVQILSGLFEAANHFAMRLPELYCGFPRNPARGRRLIPLPACRRRGPPAPVSCCCSPVLGVSIDCRRKEVHIERPLLPSGTEALNIRGLPVGDADIDLEFHRISEEVVAVPGKHVEGGICVLAHL
jgi:hypothetical protein